MASEATAFISETTQQAMLGNDYSLTNAMLLILTLVGADIFLSFVKHWFPFLEPALDGSAVILVRDGQPLKDRLNRERVDRGDILEAARLQLGLEDLSQIKPAVLERGGKISVVPK